MHMYEGKLRALNTGYGSVNTRTCPKSKWNWRFSDLPYRKDKDNENSQIYSFFFTNQKGAKVQIWLWDVVISQ